MNVHACVLAGQNGTTDSHRDRGLRSGLVRGTRRRATTEELVMSNCTRYPGLDVHAETITAAFAGLSMLHLCPCGEHVSFIGRMVTPYSAPSPVFFFRSVSRPKIVYQRAGNAKTNRLNSALSGEAAPLHLPGLTLAPGRNHS